MFNVKLTVIIVVFGLLAGLVGVLYINSLESSMLEYQTMSLQHANASVDTFLAQKTDARQLLGDLIQNSKIPIYLSTLQTFRKEMNKMQADEWNAYPNRDDPSSKLRGKMVSDTDLPDRFISELTQKLSAAFGTARIAENEMQTFMKKERARFVKCASIGVDQCVWDYTYNNYRLFSIEMSEKYGINLKSRVILIDANGFGVADSQDPKWSHVKGYVNTHPLLKKVVDKKAVVEGLDLVRREYYSAIAAPLTYKGQVVGLVEIGDPFDNALPSSWKKISNTSSIIVINGKIAASNLNSIEVKKIIKNTNSDTVLSKGPLTIYGNGARIWTRKNYRVSKANNNKVNIFLVKDTHPIIERFSSARTYFALIVIILILIVIAFVASFYKDFVTPFENIDQGLHEIVNGNKSYEFPYDFKDKLANTLSNSLNLALITMQGKPLPEESESGQWDEDVIDSVSDFAVDISSAEKAALLKEPRDKYFERLFKDMVSKSKNTENLTKQDFNRFVQKVIRNENKFKIRLDAKEVRMVVIVKGKEIGLYPVTYTAEEIKKFSAGLW